MVPASSYSQFPNKTKTFENACVIMLKCAINSKIQNKMPPWLMAKQGLLWHKSNVSVLLALYQIELLNVYILYLIHIHIYIYIYLYICTCIYPLSAYLMYMYIAHVASSHQTVSSCLLLVLNFKSCLLLQNFFLTPCMQVKC